jgi:cell division protein DivIC
MFKKIIIFLKPFVRNYYLMTAIVFIVWMVFFDSNNVITQLSNRRVLKDLMQKKRYYESEIAQNKMLVKQLTNQKDLRPIEKYAREHYLLKRPDEDIFLIIREGEKKN